MLDELSRILQLLSDINVWSVSLRVVLATVFGGLIGMNRGLHGRAAGTRTHVLVCLGAAITTMLGFYTATCLHFNNDPLRVGAQVISGIGFLGVGTIMVRNKSQVTGLTTAAGLWTTACIGLALGAGFYTLSLITFLAVILTFTVLPHLEHRMNKQIHHSYYIEFIDIYEAKAFYKRMSDFIFGVNIIPAKSGLPQHVGMELMLGDPKRCAAVLEEFEHSENIVIAIPNHL